MTIANRTLQDAIQHSAKADNTLVNFDELIWSHEVSDIARELREMNVKEFTISVCSGNLIEVLSLLEAEGFRMQGTTSVKTWYNADKEVPALLMKDMGKK